MAITTHDRTQARRGEASGLGPALEPLDIDAASPLGARLLGSDREHATTLGALRLLDAWGVGERQVRSDALRAARVADDAFDRRALWSAVAAAVPGARAAGVPR